MKFQIKMVMVYALLGVVAALAAGSIYYFASVKKINERELDSIGMSARQIEQQYDEMIVSMKEPSYYLLSDKDTLAAITSIANMVRSENTKNYFLEAEKTIFSQENNDYIRKRFYRVIFCNDNCEPISNDTEIRSGLDYRKMPWYEKAEKSEAPFTILGIHPDRWGDEEKPVFSVVMKIQGKDMGYIEVQQSLEEVQKKLRTADTELHVCVMDERGDILYGNKELDVAFCKKMMQKKDIPAQKAEAGGGIQYLTAGVYNEEAGSTILVYKDSALIKSDVLYVLYMSVFLVGVMLLVSLIYVMVSTQRLTRPLRKLEEVMDTASLENLTQTIAPDFRSSNNEFQRMAQAYDGMRERLYKAIRREKQLSDLQMQTRFDMLQAQVNPHFIYNVLNVISSRGSMNDDEVICDICDDLAGMLRYSTDTRQNDATLRQEITYLELYFSLLKYRYRHKLEYEIELEPEIEGQKLPKLVIQQLVENSISHGFRNSSKIMNISVRGYQENGYWYICVQDNGEGFSEKVLEDLEKKFRQLRMDLSDNEKSVKMQIGGMGLLNTYARLYLLNGENMEFHICNRKEGGAETIIGVKMQ